MKKTIWAIIECGDELIRAKAAMGDDNFTLMLRGEVLSNHGEKLPFGKDKAWDLIHIAECQWVRDNTDKLPCAWTVLVLITKLTEAEFKKHRQLCRGLSGLERALRHNRQGL